MRSPGEALAVTSRPDRREWLRRLALVVAAPLAMLAALEYVLWTFDVEAPEPAPDPLVRLFDYAGLQKKLAGESPSRFICLGESTVAGSPFEKRMNMCSLMEQSLRREPEPPAMVNLASSAQDSFDLLARAKAACAVKSRFVYAYFGHNEFLHLERWALFKPPEPLLAAGRFLERFRFFRFMRRHLAPSDPRGTDFDVAALTDAQVYDRFEENYQALLDACQDTRLVISTVVANNDLGFPASGMTLRETWRAFGAFNSVPSTKSCRHCFRAGPEVNRIIRRLAEKNTRDNLLLVDVEDLAPTGRGFELFWDHCHPKPALHEAIAVRTLETLAAKGWTAKVPAPKHDLTPTELAKGRLDRAIYLLQFDPPSSLRELDAISPAEITDPHGPVLLTRTLAAYVLDDGPALERGLAGLVAALELPGRREGVERCLASGAEHSSCSPWRQGVILGPSERAELAARARGLGSDLLARLFESL